MAKKKEVEEKPKAPKKPHHKITLFLLKPDAPGDRECITEEPVHASKVSVGGKPGRLFLFRSPVKRPRWYNLLAPLLPEDAARHFTSSGRISALLFFAADAGRKERRFVLALGHGAHRLSDSVYETDFGRETCLSLADTEKLISIDEQQFKDQVWNIRIQAAQASGAASFSFDPYSIVTKVTALSKDMSLGKRITGAESFVSNLPLLATDLPEVSAKLHGNYRKSVDRQALEWASRVCRISDPGLIGILNDKLIESLRKSVRGSESNSILTPPRIVEWDETETYKITGTGSKLEYSDWPYLEDVIEQIERDVIDIEFLKRCRIFAYDGQDKKYSWSLLRCLSFETKHRGKNYVLANSNWYKVEDAFLDKVNSSICEIEDFCPYEDGMARRDGSVDFSYGPKTREADYNEMVAGAFKAALFDRKLHVYNSSSHGSKVEPCDVLTKQGHFIHVKKYNGSSPLSHLFFQGLVSATCLCGDSSFRAFMRQKVRREHRWIDKTLKENGFKPDSFTTVYGIASGTGTPMDRKALPIFSKIALAHAADGLRMSRVPVKLWMI